MAEPPPTPPRLDGRYEGDGPPKDVPAGDFIELHPTLFKENGACHLPVKDQLSDKTYTVPAAGGRLAVTVPARGGVVLARE